MGYVGWEGLTPEQQAIVRQKFGGHLKEPSCDRCGAPSPLQYSVDVEREGISTYCLLHDWGRHPDQYDEEYWALCDDCDAQAKAWMHKEETD